MAEYLIQDTTLDAIADAINAKTGGSSAMTPAQMVTEIGSIQTGGSLPAPITQIAAGSFTLAEDVASYELTHALGVTPQLVFVWCEGFNSNQRDRNLSSTNMIVATQVGNLNDMRNWLFCYRQSNSAGNLITTNITYVSGDVTTQIIKLHNCGNLRSTLTTESGTNPATWRWLALAVSS